MIENSIFYNCHASVVYWDGPDNIGGKNCAMRHCIVDGSYISGVWTCMTQEDFEFHNNIVTRSEYFWIRKKGDLIKYNIEDCVITNNKHNSGYGVATGATGLTGQEVSYNEKDVVRAGEVVIEKNKNV